MQFAELQNEIKEIIDFCKMHYYQTLKEFVDRWAIAYPMYLIEVATSASVVDMTESLIYNVELNKFPKQELVFQLVITHEDKSIEKPPFLNFLKLDNFVLETSNITNQLTQTTEEELDFLTKMGFSQEQISEAMYSYIDKLLSEWTLPDDREKLLNNSSEDAKEGLYKDGWYSKGSKIKGITIGSDIVPVELSSSSHAKSLSSSCMTSMPLTEDRVKEIIQKYMEKNKAEELHKLKEESK